MRRLLIGCSLAAVLFAGLWAAASAAAPANFAGTWALDKTKSKDLPPQMENIDSLTLVVTQDAQQLTVDTKVVRKETTDVQGGGPGGGRGRGMGMGLGMGTQTYKLDGSETSLDTGGRGTAITKAEWQNDGKTLKLMTKRTFNFQGNDMTYTTNETWTLAGDGKTLTIARTSESPRGTQSSTLVFNKQ